MAHSIGIESLMGLGMPPIELIELTAELECGDISLGLGRSPINPAGYPPFDIIADKALRREIVAALRANDVRPSLGAGAAMTPDFGPRQFADTLFAPLLELGIRRLTVISLDPDVRRTFDRYGTLTELAVVAGFDEILCEPAPLLPIPDLATALEAVAHVGRPDFRIVVDTMHVGRSGGTPAELATLDPAIVGHIQLSDSKATPVDAGYGEEAVTARLMPGEGELALVEMLTALPRDRVVGLEIPQLHRALAGEPIPSIVRSIVATSRAFLARIPG